MGIVGGAVSIFPDTFRGRKISQHKLK